MLEHRTKTYLRLGMDKFLRALTPASLSLSKDFALTVTNWQNSSWLVTIHDPSEPSHPRFYEVKIVEKKV